MTSGSAGEPTAPGICPACGAPLLPVAVDPGAAQEPVSAVYREEDDSATRPVPIDQLPTRTPALSPAAPNATAAPISPAIPTDDGVTRDLPVSALPTPPGAGMARLGRMIGVVGLVAVLLAVVAGAALAINGGLPFGQRAATPTATPAATARPTATPTTQLYTLAGRYQMRYPNGWLNTQRNTPAANDYSITVVNPSGGASVSVTVQQLNQLVDPATTDTNYLNGLAAPTGTKARNISTPQAITLAGQTWTQESADVTILTSAGDQYAHAVATSINHGGNLYTIVRLVPVTMPGDAASAFAAADQADFQPILASFTFLG